LPEGRPPLRGTGPFAFFRGGLTEDLPLRHRIYSKGRGTVSKRVRKKCETPVAVRVVYAPHRGDGAANGYRLLAEKVLAERERRAKCERRSTSG